jgi:hypothetical protein
VRGAGRRAACRLPGTRSGYRGASGRLRRRLPPEPASPEGTCLQKAPGTWFSVQVNVAREQTRWRHGRRGLRHVWRTTSAVFTPGRCARGTAAARGAVTFSLERRRFGAGCQPRHLPVAHPVGVVPPWAAHRMYSHQHCKTDCCVCAGLQQRRHMLTVSISIYTGTEKLQFILPQNETHYSGVRCDATECSLEQGSMTQATETYHAFYGSLIRFTSEGRSTGTRRRKKSRASTSVPTILPYLRMGAYIESAARSVCCRCHLAHRTQ